MPLSSVPLQRIQWFIPYLNIAWVGAFLLATARDNVIAAVLGVQMISFLCLYLVGLLGNHQVKVYNFMSNMVYVAVFVAFLLYGLIWSGTSASATLWYFRIPELVLLWWIPQIGAIVYILVLPSINEILPQQLYLGNMAAAQAPELLEEFRITHILELHDEHKKNDPLQVKPELLQLEASDFLGSDKTLLKVAPPGLEFMDKVLKDPKNRLFVHCAAGGSRSPAMIVHYLVYSGREKSVEEAVKTVRSGRPFVDIGSDHLDDIKGYHEEKSRGKRD
ncbi:Dual specificity phosphatase [Seminavis robusta]|uniref:Dual specificity phosphatase n=1 Tax=Seminavis robusta TaxID=568900 RepID=A0A9N8HNH6_9STRA|nr:Dual specificity phosphatase [Seminavis robusta]|eukprot:Sro820_g207230.1 Dual specificity phosphatase (276) ;mRNA; f:17786-18613